MGYLSENNPNLSYGLLPGDAYPVLLNHLPTETLSGFQQSMLVQGQLTDTPYSLNPNYYSFAGNNGIGGGWGGVQGYPIMNLQPPSTIFNLDIPGGDGSANTSFADVEASTVGITIGGTSYNNFLTMTPSPGSAGPTVRGTYTLGIDSTNFVTAVQAAENNPTTAAIRTFEDQAGTSFTASSSDTSISVKGDYSAGGPSGYIKTELSSGGNMDVTFERNLYERFKVGGTTLSPSSQDDILEFEAKAGSNVEVTTGSDKIIVGEVVAPHGYGNLQTDGNTVSAAQVNDTVKFTNVTTSPVVAATLDIDGNDATSDIKFTMTPDPRAGFGTHLVKIIGLASPSGGTDSTIGADYDRYSILAYSFNPDTGNANSGVSGILHDYAANMLPAASDISSGAGLSNSDISRSARQNGTILMAQKVSSTVWVTSEFPVIRVSCPS